MAPAQEVKIEKDWLELIGDEFERPYMKSLKDFLQTEKSAGKTIYPKGDEIFYALNTTRFQDIKVVIIGQDPYHGEGQAHGLSFSVRRGVRIPPSLMNIYKEIENEYDVKMPKHGDLTGWAKQGVLLLNATLTVEKGLAGSHQKRGWEEFTDAVIRAVNDRLDNIVFMLWGSYAQKKGAFIDRSRHWVIQSVHPSPLSAHRGFLGSGQFRQANEYLSAHDKAPIDWTQLET